MGEFPTLADQGEEQPYPSAPSRVSAESMLGASALASGEDSESEEYFANLYAPITTMRSAPDIARHYTALLFLTAAAAGFALSLFLKSWLRDKP